MSGEKFASVWDAIEDTPEKAETMKRRSSLMMALEQHIKQAGMTEAEAAKLFGVSQPQISALMRGKIAQFPLDMLVNMAKAAGLRHTLADLLAQCDPDAPLSDEDREWFDAPTRGRELI